MALKTVKTAMGRAAGAAVNRLVPGRFWRDETGQDMVEFALVAALLALCAVATMKGLANDVAAVWGGLQRDLSNTLG